MYAIDEGRLPRMKAGQVYCPVCMQPADETAIHKGKRKMLFWHYGRNFPCVKKLVGARLEHEVIVGSVGDPAATQN